MKIMYSMFAILLVALFIAGCFSVPAPIKKAVNNDKTPVDDGNPLTPDATLKKCDAAIGFQTLIDALPTSVNGYVGDTPEGNMMTFTNPSDETVMRYSTASVNLIKDDDSIDVTITDTCYISFLSLMWMGFYEMEGTDGYLKKTTIGGNPGWHQYEKSGDSYSYNVFVKERVIVSIQGSNGVPDSDVTAVANAVNYAAISAAAG